MQRLALRFATIMLVVAAAPTLSVTLRPRGRAECQDIADIVGNARRLCSGSSPAESLRAVGVQPGAEGTVATAAEVLHEHGFRTAVDLRMLQIGGQEERELMEQLRLRGVSIADRTKVRLLIGELAHDSAGPVDRDQWAFSTAACMGTAATNHSRRSQMLRRLQDGSMSIDTVAILVSVLVGAAGYFMQAYSSRRAERVAAQEGEVRCYAPFINTAV
eukprot:SAG31_NODE_474_length_15176_cov_7.362340_2_plen_217_part_00